MCCFVGKKMSAWVRKNTTNSIFNSVFKHIHISTIITVIFTHLFVVCLPSRWWLYVLKISQTWIRAPQMIQDHPVEDKTVWNSPKSSLRRSDSQIDHAVCWARRTDPYCYRHNLKRWCVQFPDFRTAAVGSHQWSRATTAWNAVARKRALTETFTQSQRFAR